MTRPRAVLFGGPAALQRYPEFERALKRRGLGALVLGVTSADQHQTTATGRFLHFHLCDPANLNDMVRTVREWTREIEICAVVNTEEALVWGVAVLAEMLGLPSPGMRAACVASDKYLQRSFLSQMSPPHELLTAQAGPASFDAYPAAIKPTARHGGSGIQLIGSAAKLGGLLDAAVTESFLIEAFVEGIDVSVESLVHNGTVMFENVTEEADGGPADFFLELGYTMPAARLDQESTAAVLRINRELLDVLNFRTGICHAEYKVTSSGQVVLMEVAARCPGDGLFPLYQLAAGKPLEEAVVALMLNEAPQYPPLQRWARQVYFSGPPGRLTGVVVHNKDAPVVYVGDGERPPPLSGDEQGLIQVLVDHPRGAMLGPVQVASGRWGSFLVAAGSLSELNRYTDDVEHHLRVLVGS